MAVTDLTGALPWWVTGAAPPAGAPTPPGARGMTSWYDYLASMFAPSAQADTLTQSQQLNGLLAARANSAQQPQPGDIPIGPNTIPAAPSPYAGPQPGLGAPNYTNPMLAAGATPGAGLSSPATTPAPGGGVTAPGAFNPNAPTQSASPVSAPKGPLAGGGATGQGATSNPRFVPVDRPNAPAGGSAMGRGGPPQMSALNLAGLFGGAQNAPAAAGPTQTGRPTGPLATRGGASLASNRAPWGMGPLQKGMVWPSAMGPFTPDQIAAASLRQRYG